MTDAVERAAARVRRQDVPSHDMAPRRQHRARAGHQRSRQVHERSVVDHALRAFYLLGHLTLPHLPLPFLLHCCAMVLHIRGLATVRSELRLATWTLIGFVTC